MEDWKQPFYDAPLDRNFPSEPLHALYERAWKRVEADDGPRFQKVK